MAHGQNLEYTAFQRSMAELDNIRHGIDQISEKVFAENLISEGNKCLNTNFGELERTKSLKNALLGRTKSRPDTFDIFVRLLKETTGMDFIGDLLEENLETVKAELAVPKATMRNATGYTNVLPDPSFTENGIQISRAGDFDSSSTIPAFRREYSPKSATQVGYWVGTIAHRRRSRDLTPPPTARKPKIYLKSRSRSLTPPPAAHRSEHGNIISPPSLPPHLDPQVPDTPPFEPISFNVRTKVSAANSPTVTLPPLSEQDKDGPGISTSHTKGSEQKRTVRFSTPMHSDSETEAAVHAPMPVSGPEREATSNPSPSLVTGQSGTNFRASLEVPTSPNLFMLRSNSTGSTGSTDTDSDVYVTPRQSLSDLEAEKLFRRSKKAACKNCLTLGRSFSNSQEEICKLRTKLQARNNLMLDQVTMLKEEMFQKELECHDLKETCTTAVLFVQELEAKVVELKQLVYSKEMKTEEAWRYYHVALDFMQRCSSPQTTRNLPFNTEEGRHGWLAENDQDGESRAELSCSTGDESDSENNVVFFGASMDHGSGNRQRSREKRVTIPGCFVLSRNASQSRSQGREFTPIAPYVKQFGKKQATTKSGDLSRSRKLITMVTHSMPPPRRVASDSHPKKVHNVCTPRSSLQHETYYHSATTSEHTSIPTASSHHKSRHSNYPQWQGGKHRVYQAETGYWEEEERRRPTSNNIDGGSFVPESSEMHDEVLLELGTVHTRATTWGAEGKPRQGKEVGEL